MVLCTQVSFEMAFNMASVTITGQVVCTTKDHGEMGNATDLVPPPGKMGLSTLETTKTIKNKAKAPFTMPMAKSIEAVGRMANNMGMDNFGIKRISYTVEIGKKENRKNPNVTIFNIFR